MTDVEQVSTRGGFRIRTVMFSDGERCPMLVDADSGLPIYQPTIWTVSAYRRRSASTMELALRGAMLLHLFCTSREIDLDARIRDGTFLTIAEMDDLANQARQPARALYDQPGHQVNGTGGRRTFSGRIAHLTMMRTRKKIVLVQQGTKSMRLRYLREYVLWRGGCELSRTGPADASEQELAGFRKAYADALHAFSTAMAARAGGSQPGNREALTREQRAELERIVDPTGSANPWASDATRFRNHLMVKWLLETGMRRGELLSLRVKDVHMPLSRAEIVRKPDDRKDPRRRAPTAKTVGRYLTLSDDLVRLTDRYIREFRGQTKSARRHGFLFVSRDGAPLSLAALGEMFQTLRNAFPQVGPVSAHVLRHCWNEDFSEHADLIGMGEDEERRTRCSIAGWSLRSKMPDHYLKRKIREKAAKASKSMQSKMMGGSGSE